MWLIGRSPGGRNAQNEPNLSIADWTQTCGGATNRAKQSQFRSESFETKPICPRAGNGRGRPGRGGRNAQNEPNFGGRPGPGRPKCVKRTQSPAAEIPRHPSIPLLRRSSPMQIVRNEPNFGGSLRLEVSDVEQMCKTNPIWGTWLAGGIPSIPLFYHSTIPVRCRLCETNPICGSPRGTGIPSASLSGQALPVDVYHGQSLP